MTTYTIYADTADGYIESYHSAYATARSGGTRTIYAAATYLSIGQEGYEGGDGIYCYEAFLSFDTTGISGVASAALSLNMGDDASNTDFIIEARVRDWGSTLGTDDWVAGASLGGLTLAATLNTSGIGAPGEKTFTDVALAANINSSGSTRLLLASDQLRLGILPASGNDMVFFSAADTTGTTQDPKLVIVTGSANSASFFLMF